MSVNLLEEIGEGVNLLVDLVTLTKSASQHIYCRQKLVEG